LTRQSNIKLKTVSKRKWKLNPVEILSTFKKTIQLSKIKLKVASFIMQIIKVNKPKVIKAINNIYKSNPVKSSHSQLKAHSYQETITHQSLTIPQ
jgi:hypothetical protein